jgi:hypothetical protein
MSYFVDAVVEYAGQAFRFAAEEARAFEDNLNCWHSAGDPSTWLSVTIFMEARRRVKGAPDEVAQELAAKALGITVEKLRANIEWHENYMRWHDGDPDYRVL